MCSPMTVTTKAKIAQTKNRYFLWNVAVDKHLGKRTVNQKVFKDHVSPFSACQHSAQNLVSWSLLPGNLKNEYQRFPLATKKSIFMPRTIRVPCYNYSFLWHKIHAVETAALNKSTIGVSSWREILSVASASDVYSDHEIKRRGHCLVRDVDPVAYRWGGCRTGAAV